MKDRKKNLPNQSKAMYSADEDSIGTYIEQNCTLYIEKKIKLNT